MDEVLKAINTIKGEFGIFNIIDKENILQIKLIMGYILLNMEV